MKAKLKGVCAIQADTIEAFKKAPVGSSEQHSNDQGIYIYI